MACTNGAKSGEELAHAQGLQGELFLFPERIRISRKVVGSYFSRGLTGDRDVLIRDISSIKFQATGMFSNGYIQFAFKGGANAKKGMQEAAHDENTMVFTKQQEYEFEQFRDKLQRMLQTKTTQSDTSLNNIEKTG